MISKHKFLAVLLGLTGVCILNAQKEADVWITGYSGNGTSDTIHGMMLWNFMEGDPKFEYKRDFELTWISETNSSICNADGNLLFVTNGMEVFDTLGGRIVDTIAYLDDDANWTYYFLPTSQVPAGFPKSQTAIILPVPGAENEYSIIYYHAKSDDVTLFFTVVAILEARVHLQNNSWTLLYKDKKILEKSTYLSEGTWHACRHANGRDWWMLIHDYIGSNYYKLLLDPTGLHLHSIQTDEPEVRNLMRNAWFSSDGTKYVKYPITSATTGYIYIYDFDRCTGLLSNRVEIFIEEDAMSLHGCAISPNSRFLYASAGIFKLCQWDLWAEDIAGSKILIDTMDGFVEPGWFYTDFGTMMPGPDGRIYMIPNSGSSRYVHVIDRPNDNGKESRLLQHHILLPTWNARSIPNHANFRLGPLDGSPCDTLGLDNHPQSRWRYETEDVDPLEIRFTDLSFFRPEIWFWDFGDGETSSTEHPIHTYPSPGIYYACLTVSNEYSADSSCQWIEIESVSTDDTERDEAFIVHPNPFTDYIEITPPDSYNTYRTLHVTIIDIHGRVIASPEITCPCRLKLGSIPDGVYFYTLEEVDFAGLRRPKEGKMVGSGKILKSGNR